jgi:hypothetical protein
VPSSKAAVCLRQAKHSNLHALTICMTRTGVAIQQMPYTCINLR